MPFKSLAQAGKLASLARQGKFPVKSLEEWRSKTNFAKIPNKVPKKHG